MVPPTLYCAPPIKTAFFVAGVPLARFAAGITQALLRGRVSLSTPGIRGQILKKSLSVAALGIAGGGGDS